MQEQIRMAACACGAVSVSALGEPIVVNACSCGDCQLRSGSAFTYTAFYQKGSVVLSGALNTFRNSSDSGRWRDSLFCPTCGVTMLTRLEVFPHAVGVPVGALADTAYPAPNAFYWAKRKHAWYSLDAPVPKLPEQ